MKIAVSEHQNNVALTFDFSNTVTIFTCDNGVVTNKERLELHDHFIPLRCAKLREHGVEIVICGAISISFVIMLQHRGIKILSGITGDIDSVVQDFLRGAIDLARNRMQVFAGSGRRRSRGKRGCNGNRRNRY